ncbi:MAG: hypothetical protein ACK54Z_05735 [Cyanobacteriota bacterium]
MTACSGTSVNQVAFALLKSFPDVFDLGIGFLLTDFAIALQGNNETDPFGKGLKILMKS